MKDFQENIISAVNQNDKHFFTYGNGEFKVMFVGNSITKHRPVSENWNRDCGMWASSPEKDYVHQFIKMMTDETGKNVSYSIVTAADFERQFDTVSPEELYFDAREYNPDVMIMFFGANVPKEYDEAVNPKVKFGDAYEKLRNYLKGDNTLIFHSQGFYIRPVLDAEKEAVAKKYGDAFINIENIRNRAETHGLCNHPNDLGMKEIADEFWKAIKPKITVCNKEQAI